MQIKFKRCLCDIYTKEIDKELVKINKVEEYMELEYELLDIEKENLNACSEEDKAKTRMQCTYEIWIDSQHIGYIGCQDYEHQASKSRMLCIVDFMIKPEYRRKGYGRKALDEFIRKNKKDYFSIYCWCSKHNQDALEFYKQVGVFLVADPNCPIKFTADYKRDGLIKLDDAYAVLFYEDGERYKGSEIDV